MTYDNLNFGVCHNGMTCNCGAHKGCGELHEGDRAARYARMRDRTPSIMTTQNKKYLETWEQAHGKVTYYFTDHDVKVDKGNKDIWGEGSIGQTRQYQIARIQNYSKGLLGSGKSSKSIEWHQSD